MVSAGPWKPIRLEIYQSRFEELHFPVAVADDLSVAAIDYSIAIESPPSNATVRVALYPPKDDNPMYTQTFPAAKMVNG